MSDSAENDCPSPPGPPSHEHQDGSRCMWVRRGGIDRWRQVDRTGWDSVPPLVSRHTPGRAKAPRLP